MPQRQDGMRKQPANRNKTQRSDRDTIESINQLCHQLDQSHSHERKIRFLLDIRGYLIVNQVQGNYIEFGCYKAEMLYAASYILSKTTPTKNYIGVDTFENELDVSPQERQAFPGLDQHDYIHSYEDTKQFVSKYLGNSGKLVNGDFRDERIQNICQAQSPFNVIVVDCNTLSGIQAACNIAARSATNGAVLYIDDYFCNMADGTLRIEKIINKSFGSKTRLVDFNTYPPFAKAFLITTKQPQ